MSGATERFPAASDGPYGSGPGGWPGSWAAPAGRRAWVGGGLPAGDPVAGWVVGKVAGRRDPVRKFMRRRRRARRALEQRLLLTAGLVWLALTVGSQPRLEFAEVFWGSAAALVAWRAVAAGRRVWRLAHTLPPPPAPGPLPPADSVARPAMERLRHREQALADLLVHLGPAAGDTRFVAADAAAALRLHAARALAVDQARRGVPASALPGLDAALDVLLRQLDDGLAGYDALVAAVADAVCAAATFQAANPVLAQRLRDATDALAGLAAGLREVSAG